MYFLGNASELFTLHEYMSSPIVEQELFTLHEHMSSPIVEQELFTLHEHTSSPIVVPAPLLVNSCTHEG
jgi:hypothetical protein